jgi:hypothetical protein
MRIASAVTAILAVPAVLALTPIPAQAQTGYAVCLKVYGPATYTECNYTSMAQCKATASGRAAECYPNAFAAYPAPVYAPRRGYRRHYDAY